jgi:hypothetical protein
VTTNTSTLLSPVSKLRIIAKGNKKKKNRNDYLILFH